MIFSKNLGLVLEHFLAFWRSKNALDITSKSTLLFYDFNDDFLFGDSLKYWHFWSEQLGCSIQDCIKNISHGNNACILKDDGDQAVGAVVNMQQFNILKRIEQNFQKVNEGFKEIGKNMTEEEVENFAREAVKYARSQILGI